MIDKVQKIREEVARIQLYTQSEVLKQVLDYIDEVQKEPVSMWHDGCEIPESETNILMLRKDVKDSNYPPIAGCFYGTNSRLDGRNWGYYNGFCYNEIEPPIKWAYIDDILNLSNVQRTVKNCEEPVSEDLGEYINELSKQFPEVSFAKLSRIAVRAAKWQKAKDQETIETAIHHAYHNGRLEMKEQIMAKAIDGTARPDDNEIWCNLTSNNLEDGDKVKVIVVKEG